MANKDDLIWYRSTVCTTPFASLLLILAVHAYAFSGVLLGTLLLLIQRAAMSLVHCGIPRGKNRRTLYDIWYASIKHAIKSWRVTGLVYRTASQQKSSNKRNWNKQELGCCWAVSWPRNAAVTMGRVNLREIKTELDIRGHESYNAKKESFAYFLTASHICFHQ